MSDNPEDYELVHYGVKGMKWGVRKGVDASKNIGKKAAEGTSKAVKRVKKKYDTLSPESKSALRETAALAVGAAIAAGGVMVAKKASTPMNSINSHSADKIDKYLRARMGEMDWQEAEILNNYSQQVRRGDY